MPNALPIASIEVLPTLAQALANAWEWEPDKLYRFLKRRGVSLACDFLGLEHHPRQLRVVEEWLSGTVIEGEKSITQ